MRKSAFDRGFDSVAFESEFWLLAVGAKVSRCLFYHSETFSLE